MVHRAVRADGAARARDRGDVLRGAHAVPVGRGAAHGGVRQDAGARRRHAVVAGRREDLSRDAGASGDGVGGRSQRGADPRRRRGRDAARGAARSVGAALHDGGHRRRGRRAVEEVFAGVFRRSVRRPARSRDHRRRAEVHQRRHRSLWRRDQRSDGAAAGLAVVPAVQRRRLSRHQGAARAGRCVRAASVDRRIPQHGAARQDGALASGAFQARAKLLHARSRVRQRLGVHRLQRRRRCGRNGTRANRRVCRRAARRELVLRRRDASAVVRPSACTCAASSRRTATSSPEPGFS